MITKDDQRSIRGVGLGVAIFVVGVAVGMLANPRRWTGDSAGSRDDRSPAPPAGSESTSPHAEVRDNGLATLELRLNQDAMGRLESVRDRALARGIIQQTAADTVPATLVHDGAAHNAEVRIKGDWLDHVEGDKWSLRITLDDPLFGMSVFSVQAPETRGLLWEWFVLETMRREGVLAPRARFVNVVVNDQPKGVYYLEEHFSKELLESQGRREGPIVIWDESTMWSTFLDHDLGDSLPDELRSATQVGSAPVRAYKEKRLRSIDSLRQALHGAVEKMRRLRDLAVAADTDNFEPLRRQQALRNLEGQTVERLVHVDRLARMHALASMFQLKHPLIWHNQRYYHDPVLDVLEPIAFDNMADTPGGRSPVPFRADGVTAEFSQSRAYYAGVFRNLGTYCQPRWLDDLFADVEPELRVYEAALLAEKTFPERYRIESMKQRLRAQQGFLRTLIFPSDPINFAAWYELDETGGSTLSGTMYVRAWTTSRTPAVVQGFRFSNGSMVEARKVVRDELGQHLLDAEGVVLPRDGRPLLFAFPLDERLTNLENVRQIKAAIREGAPGVGELNLDVDVLFRPLAAETLLEEALLFRRVDPVRLTRAGRPAAPSIQAALGRHAFLRYDLDARELHVVPGEWEVEGDLIVPDGVGLRIEAGTTLRFHEDALLLCTAPLEVEGTSDQPVVFEPAVGARSFSGILVLDAARPTTWHHAIVRNTAELHRGSWITTGGVTFYHSPVTLRDCLFEGTVAEDGLNVFGCEMTLERVTFSGCASDCFDGDFVTGALRDCRFIDGEADGIDLSGSTVNIVRCEFERLADKAISIGERSVVHSIGGHATDVGIAVAAKDRSEVEIRRLAVLRARHVAFAAYVKKPEYGPATLRAIEVEVVETPLAALAQTGNELIYNGARVATTEVDVELLYREQVLGR